MGTAPRPAVLARLRAGPPLLWDGAMATLLRAEGWPADRPVELASVEAPARVRAVHAAYARAGAEVLTANTYGAHGSRLEAWALGDRVEELCRAAVGLAREAAGATRWVAASVGPPGEPLLPLGDRSFRAAVAAYRRQLAACRAAGADLYVLESFTDLLEVQAALTAAAEEGVGPVAVSMTLAPDRLAQGLVSPAACVEVAEALGAALVGVNCMPPPQVASAVEAMRGRARGPVFAQPSAGAPSAEAGYPIDPEEFAAWTARLLALGVRGIGGCCGTTPAHLEGVAREVAARWRRPGPHPARRSSPRAGRRLPRRPSP